MFAKIEKGALTRYPTYDRELRGIYGELALPANLGGCEYLGKEGWVEVAATEKPDINPITQFAAEASPALVAGVWRQTWSVNDYTDEDLKNNAKQAFESVKSELISAVNQHLNRVARSMGRVYSDQQSVCSYLNSSIAKFHGEAYAFMVWRDAVWARCFTLEADVLGGLRQPPTPEALILELPVFAL